MAAPLFEPVFGLGLPGVARRGSLSLVALASLLVGCGGGSEAAQDAGQAAPQTVDLGNGYLASLSADGALQVTHAGAPVLATAAGTSLFAALHDPVDPAGFHDPTSLAGVAWASVVTGVAMTSPAPGELHLVLPDQGPDTALVSLALATDSAFASGLGERYTHVDARGAVTPMHLAIDTRFESGTNDAHVPVPLLVSAGGYGVFVASREAGAFDHGVTEPGVVRAAFEGRTLDVTVFLDPDPLAVVAAYARRTGLPRRTPLWSLAPMHWRQWPSAAAVIADATQYRARKIPASTLWIDDGWQTSYNSAVLNPQVFGEPAKMMAQLAALGFRVPAWSTPYLEKPVGAPADRAQELYAQAAPAGYFVSQQGGGVWVPVGCCYKHGLGMLDFTNAKAVTFWEGVLKSATDAGIDGFKLDYGEDLVPDLLGSRLYTLRSDGESERTARTYPLGYHAAYHGALDAARPDGFLLGRASAYGGQKFVDAIWPGDLDNDFSTRTNGRVGGLPAAIVAAQTLSVSGFPAFGSDTGGYRAGTPAREVILRWAEHTAFSVIMQLYGGGDGSHDPWAYGEEAAATYATLARAHMRLVPYLGSLTRVASATGTPTIRPLPFAYPADLAGIPFADTEYLLGPDLLVAPVVQPGVSSRAIHFPPGSWAHWFDRTLVEGPTESTVPAPLGTPAVYLRAGALVPLYPDGLDTLVDATAPGVVTLASRSAGVEARAFVAGPAEARFEEGSTLAVADAAKKVTVTWTPVAPVARVFVELDLRKSGLAGASSIGASLAGGAKVALVADEAAARAATAPALAVDAKAGKAWLSLGSKGAAELVAGAP